MTLQDGNDTWSAPTLSVTGVRAELEDLRRASDRMAKLQAVTAALSEARLPADVARVVETRMADVVGADKVALAVPSSSPGELVVLAYGGEATTATKLLARFPVTAELPIAKAFRTGACVWVRSKEQHARDFPHAPVTDERVVARACAPLVIRGQMFGALGFGYGTARTFEVAERDLVQELANQTALALERARLYEGEQNARRRLEILACASRVFEAGDQEIEALLERTVFEVGPALESAIGISLVDANGQMRLTAFHHADPGARAMVAEIEARAQQPLGDGVRSNVARTGLTFFLPSVEPPVAAVHSSPEYRDYLEKYPVYAAICVPLRVRGTIIGTLMAMRTRETESYTTDDRILCEELADKIAAAIERARLFEARVAAEQALRESEERFRIMADGTPVMIWVTDPSGRLLFVNRAHCEFFGTTLEQVQAKDWVAFVHPADAEAGVTAFEVAHRQRREMNTRGRVRRADGEWRWIESYGRPRYSGRGEFLGLAGSSIDVTDRVRADEALREADRRKDEFLAVLSHELRNPLAPIRNGLTIIERSPPGSDPARRALGIIHRQVTHMTRLVDDLLDVTRVVRGKIQLRREPTSLTAIVARTIEDHRASFEASGVTLAVALTSEPLGMSADSTRIAQVVGNLLINATKFTPRGGQVEVTLERRAHHAVLKVADDGVGMTPDLLARIFEPFTQADDTLDRSRGGLGLGLALVRGLVELHGGRVEASSAGVGRGSTFTVQLPLERVEIRTDSFTLPTR